MSEKSSTVDDILVAGNATFPSNGTPFPGTPDNRTDGQPTAAENGAGPFPWRGARTTARSALAALVVMVMALGAFLGTTKPALAAPVPGTGEQGANVGTATARLSWAAVSDKICMINAATHDKCDSTNRELIVEAVNSGDTENCTFRWKIYWGDETTKIVTTDGAPADDPTFIQAIHFYKEPRGTTIYDVYAEALSVTGGCTIGSGSPGMFILVVPTR